MAGKKKTVVVESEPLKLVGLPCGSCGFHSEQLIGSGVGYCDRYKTWQFPDRRPWNCESHVSRESLEGLLMLLRQAVIWNRHARDWVSGINVGTPTDPRHPMPTKRQIKEAEAEIDRQSAIKADRWIAEQQAKGTGL